MTHSQRSNNSFLSIEKLEDRDVPAVNILDLTTNGASGAINGALFQQYDAGRSHQGDLESIVRIQASGRSSVEQGYNTDARPLQFDERSNRSNNHSIRVGDLPLVTVGGTAYREVLLDIDENRQNVRLSLDELRVFVGDSNTLRGYSNGKLANLNPVYDMDAVGDSWVKLDASLNRARSGGDMQFLVRNDLLGGDNKFIYLYSKFGAQGGRFAAGGGFEEWAVGTSVSSPPVTASTISGFIYNSFPDSLNTSGGNVVLYVNGEQVQSFPIGADGSYSIDAGAIASGASVTILVLSGDGQSAMASFTWNPTGQPSVQLTMDFVVSYGT